MTKPVWGLGKDVLQETQGIFFKAWNKKKKDILL